MTMTASWTTLLLVTASAFSARACEDDQAGARMYSLTVHVVGAGVVGSLDGNIHCTEACDKDPSCRECDSGDVYRTDDRIPLTAYPESGQQLSAIDGALCAVDAPECIVTIVGNRAVTFTFAPNP